MVRRTLLTLLLGASAASSMPAGALAPAARPAPTQRAQQRPNIVLIVLDDTGYADLGCFGSEIRTPNIDALARDGLRYTRFESRAICSPTRAALLTARNNQTVGVADLTATALDHGRPGKNAGELVGNAETVAQALQASGYATLAIGKWHLAPEAEDGTPGRNASWPLQRGFDYFYGFLPGWADQYKPDLAENNRPIGQPDRPGYHFSADIVDKAVERIDARDAGRPYFLYLAFGATHAPFQVAPSYIERYAGVYERGWDTIRAERLARQKRLGIAPANTALPPINPGDRPWSSLTAAEKTVYARYMATYAGFLEHADEQVGRLIARLKANGTYNNTLFVLLSDNGAANEAGQTGSFGQLYPPNRPKAADLLPRLGEFGRAQIDYPRPWAMASVSPLRRYKTWPYAGGVRTPMIVAWPGHIADRGGLRRQAVDAIDIAPTLVEAAGARFDPNYRGMAQLPVAGASFARTLASARAPNPRDVQFFELRGNRAIRQGKWRAVAVHRLGTPFESDTWQLFDTEKDFAEAQDVSSLHPAKVAELKALWQREAARYGDLPLDEGPAYIRQRDRYRDEFLKPGELSGGD